jgi:hypothetical protein
VVWGDLGKSKKQTNNEKEEEYTRFLVIAVARRTNLFRVSTYMTKWAYLGLLTLTVLGALPWVEEAVCKTPLKETIPPNAARLVGARPPVEIYGGSVQFGGVQHLETVSPKTNPPCARITHYNAQKPCKATNSNDPTPCKPNEIH